MKLVVAGTGYVGLVAGVCFAEKGHDVTCVDVDENKVKLMESGVSPIYEAGLEELMQRNYEAGRLHYTVDYKNAYRDADAIFIGVGTPEQSDGSANLSYIATVCRQIAESVEKDCLVVVKSTVPVGTNDRVEQFIQDFLVRKELHIEVASILNFWLRDRQYMIRFMRQELLSGQKAKRLRSFCGRYMNRLNCRSWR